MMISEKQQLFILAFLYDANLDFNQACVTVGVLPSVARLWFASDAFLKAKETAHKQKLALLGYGPLLAIEDTLAIAHSDITRIQQMDADGRIVLRDLADLPRRDRIAIDYIEYGVAFRKDGDGLDQPYIYPKKIKMKDKAWAMQRVAEWYDVANHEFFRTSTNIDEGPKRIAGLVVRPPLTIDEWEGEKLLETDF